MKQLYPIVTTDIALFTLIDATLRVLLVRRSNDPMPGSWALPGGLLKPDQDTSLNAAARRILADKTRVEVPHLEQVMTVGGPDRDPRGWSISTVYYALLPADRAPAVAGSRVEAVSWFGLDRLPSPLAFDHADLVEASLGRLREKVGRGALPLHLLPERFVLSDLQRTCEAILGARLDKGAFRRQIRDAPSLVPVEGEFLRGPQRPAQIYRKAKGFVF